MRKDGFTVIELVVTIFIAVSLAAIAIPEYNKFLKRAREVSGVVELKQAIDGQILFAQTPRYSSVAQKECFLPPQYRLGRMSMMVDESWNVDNAFPSIGKTSTKRFYEGIEIDSSFNVAANGLCDYTIPLTYYYVPADVLGLKKIKVVNLNGTLGEKMRAYVTESLPSSYFNIQAHLDVWAQISFGADAALSVFAVANFDGWPASNLPSLKLGGANTPSLLRSNQLPYTVLSRIVYLKNNEVFASPGVYRREEVIPSTSPPTPLPTTQPTSTPTAEPTAGPTAEPECDPKKEECPPPCNPEKEDCGPPPCNPEKEECPPPCNPEKEDCGPPPCNPEKEECPPPCNPEKEDCGPPPCDPEKEKC